MTPARFHRLAGPTVIGLCVMLLAPGTASAQSSETSVPPTTEATADAQVDCMILDADVDSGTATFTIGPDGCANPVGPVSFSTYELPSGQILPYAQQVLIAHAAGNGSSYGAGAYTLTASLGSALNWQADLYYGESDDQPPHPNMIDVDAQVGVVAVTTTATPSTAPTTNATETTAPAANTPATTENQVASLTPSVSVATPTATVVLAPAPPAGSEVAGAQTTTTAPSVALPQTASSSTAALVAAAGALTVVGWACRRLTRRPPTYGN